MKKIFAIVITVAMLLSLGAVMASAATEVSWTEGQFAVADASEFTPVGTIKIDWDADAADKLDLTDGDMADWQAAGYTAKTIDASNMVSWVGNAEGVIDPGMPDNWNITTYFVADSEWLYIGFYVTDPNFVYGDNAAGYNGDAFQICIDFGGKLGEAVEKNPDKLENFKNIFYSFTCISDGAPLEIMRQESSDDKILSEANGDGVKGAAKKTDAGWSAEFALSFEQMFKDYEWKAWEEDSTIYVGGEDNKPLTIGCCLYYQNRTSAPGAVEWAAGTSNGKLLDNGKPGVSWTCYDNGINLELDIEDGVTFDYENIVIMAADETEPPTVEEEEDPTDAPTEAPTDAPTEAPTDAPTEAPTAAPTDDAGATDEGCASVIGFGAVAVLAAAAAVVALKKKD